MKGIRIKKINWGLGDGAKDAVGSATNAYLMSRGACGSSCISSMIGLFIYAPVSRSSPSSLFNP